MTSVSGPIIEVTSFAVNVVIPFSLILYNYARIARTLFKSVKVNVHLKEGISMGWVISFPNSFLYGASIKFWKHTRKCEIPISKLKCNKDGPFSAQPVQTSCSSNIILIIYLIFRDDETEKRVKVSNTEKCPHIYLNVTTKHFISDS